jgi:uncharacterized membrane protein YkoI
MRQRGASRPGATLKVKGTTEEMSPMRKPIQIAMMAGAAGVIVAGGTAAAFAVQGGNQPTKATTTYSTSAPTTPASPKAAGTVNAAQARQIAQQLVRGGTVTETGLDHEHGKAVWEVDLTKNNRHYEVHIDAATGKIIGAGASKASASHASQPAAGKVSAVQARQIAQQRVPGAMVTETDFDHEHGKAVWEVDLTRQHRHYEVHIDAATGQVLGVHQDTGMGGED